jgi:hypothetical protein
MRSFISLWLTFAVASPPPLRNKKRKRSPSGIKGVQFPGFGRGERPLSLVRERQY